MSPERVYGEISPDKPGLMAKADIWSVGVLIHILVFGKMPFEGETYSKLIKAIKKGEIKERSKELSGELKSLVDLMTQMLQVDLNDRFDAL